MAGNEGTLRIAAAQIETILGDVTANLRQHRDWIERARAAAVDVLVFPELSLTGYSLRETARDVALSCESACIREVAAAAGPMAVTFGLVERATDGRLFNTAMTVRNGEALFVHRKINLPGYGRLEENRWFAAGERIETFALAPGWTAATLLCADLWNPALVHIAACRGADLLIAPASSAIGTVEGFDNPRGWATALDFYAMMYGLPTIMANRCGREDNLTFWGGSRVIDAAGLAIARGDHGEALVTANILRADVDRARGRLPTVRDSMPDLVRAEFNRWASGLHTPPEERMAS